MGEVTQSQWKAEQEALFPLGPFPHTQRHNTAKWVALPGEHLRLHPLLHNRCTETKKKNMAQMKEQIKAPEKIQLSDKRDSQHIRRRVQNTGDQDAHRDG